MSNTMRKRIYAAFDTAGVVIGAVEAGCLAAGKHPLALQVAVAVYAFLSSRVHGIARKHVPDTVTEPLPEKVDTDSGTD